MAQSASLSSKHVKFPNTPGPPWGKSAVNPYYVAWVCTWNFPRGKDTENPYDAVIFQEVEPILLHMRQHKKLVEKLGDLEIAELSTVSTKI